ncbi:MAG: chemotaxis protein CheW [Cycloclasticus sp.]|nr:chemotaxis protein CheW [Cycloclasticus sp.]
MGDNKLHPMLEQDEAIDSYFNDLLSTLDEPRVEQKSPSTISLVTVKSTSEVEKINDEAELIDSVEVTKIKAERIELEKVEAERVEAERAIPCQNTPIWAGQKFKAIVGVVNNVKLALPVSLCAEKIAFTSDLKAVKGQLDWVLGVKLIDKNFIAVVDVGSLLLNQTVRDVIAKPYKEIILLKNSRWGLAFDSLSEEIEINTTDVKWREESSGQPWLCGFMSEQQLAVVDPAMMFIEDK